MTVSYTRRYSSLADDSARGWGLQLRRQMELCASVEKSELPLVRELSFPFFFLSSVHHDLRLWIRQREPALKRTGSLLTFQRKMWVPSLPRIILTPVTGFKVQDFLFFEIRNFRISYMDI